MTGAVRPASFAGTWYPSDAAELTTMIDAQLDGAGPTAVDGTLLGMVSPHAGLRYSGRTAAAGYRLLRERELEAAVLLGPSHRQAFDALAVYPDGSFDTPLGPVHVDRELAASLLESSPAFRPMPDVHRAEHSLEMQLPFLERVAPSLGIVPVMMGHQSEELIAAAAAALAEVLGSAGRRVLLLASSDLSHFYSRERARALDDGVLRCLEDFDPDGLRALLSAEPDHACGGGPIVSVMRAARSLGASRGAVLAYGDSGDASGDTDSVVGYVSAAFTALPA